MDARPIGIFDSGVGGLTVVKELTRLLPHENFVYFGDTGRVPYGTKSPETIRAYAHQDMALLRQYDIKMLIAACGTVSALLCEEETASLLFPYTGVVSPAAKKACKLTKTRHIAVLGTPAAIQSDAYQQVIRTQLPDAKITAIPCPLFVPLVEHGRISINDPIPQLVAKQYLNPLLLTNADTVILGCTHFPVLHDVINQVLGSRFALINPGSETAKVAAEILAEQDLLCSSQTPKQIFLVSDDAENFAKNAARYLGHNIAGQIEKVSLP